MANPSPESPSTQKLPWTPPTVTRVPIVSHTRGAFGFFASDAGSFDDFVGAS
jgi:hypothetical protein